jgi:hypothetical protein
MKAPKANVTVRLSPSQITALRDLGGDISEHIRTGVQWRIDMGEYRRVISQMVREEVKGALSEIVTASRATDETNRQMLASFLAALHSLPNTTASNAADEPAPTPTKTGVGVDMPKRNF